MLFAYLVFWVPALIFMVLLGMEIYENKKFFSNSIETTGNVVGTLDATVERTNAGVTTVANASNRSHLDIMTTEKEIDVDGQLLIVEYADRDGNRHQVHSRQTFHGKAPSTVQVNYDPNNTSNVAVEGYYTNTSSYAWKTVVILGLVAAPFVIDLFSSQI